MWNIKDHSYKFKHGHARSKDRPASREYTSYVQAKGRCQNCKDDAYHNYGGRGIEFRFESFEQFLAELGLKPSPKHSIDRIDVNGHYEPGNVRWATHSEQQLNKRCNPRLTVGTETLTTVEWGRKQGLARNTVRERVKRGWCSICAATVIERGTCEHIKRKRRSPARMITFRGKTQHIAAWTRELNLTRGVIAHRLNIGWTVEQALTTPVGPQGRK